MDIAAIRTTEFRDELYNVVSKLDRSTIKACLNFEDCSEAFLHELFFWYPMIGDDDRAAILNHANCPDLPLLCALQFYPELAQGSASIVLRDMSGLAGAADSEWTKTKDDYLRKKFTRQVDLWVTGYTQGRWYRRLDDCIPLWSESFIDRILNETKADDIKSFASAIREKRVVDIFLRHRDYRVRTVAARKFELQYVAELAKDSSVAVRKTLAKRSKLPDDVKKILAADEARSVREALSGKNSVNLANMVDLKSSQQSDNPEDIINMLMVFRDKKLPESKLVAMAQHPSGIVRYAAGLHKKATNSVYDELMKNPTDWSCAPVASRSRNPDYLSQFAVSEHLDVIRHLSFNKKLEKSTALELLEKHQDNEMRLGIASTFVEDNEVVEKVIATQPKKGQWEMALLEATNPTTSSKQLRQIYYDSMELCVHRAIARHPNCPKHQAAIFGCYLKNDLIKNPKIAMALMENKKLPYHGYSDWSHLNRMKEDTAPAFLSNSAAKNSAIEFSRGAASCRSVNAIYLDRAVLNGDTTTYKNIFKYNLEKLGRFSQEVLSLTTTANKKLLIKSVVLHPETIERLANDKDKSVRVALENSKQGSKKSKPTESVKVGDKLGNKATRMELAEGSVDTNILEKLCKDKLPTVRAKVVENANITPDMLIPLLEDPDSEVVANTLQALSQLTLDKNQQKLKQSTLITALEKVDGLDKKAGAKLIDAIDDVTTVENAYMMGKLAGLEGSIAKRVETESVFNALLSQAQQLGDSAKDWCVELSSYAGIDVKGFNEILKITGPVIRRKVRIDKNRFYSVPVRPLQKLKSADVYIEIVKAKGWNWVKSTDCAYPAEAEFTREQMETLCAIDPGCLLGIGENCNRLDLKQLIGMFDRLETKEKENFLAYVLATHMEFNNHVYDWCTEHYKKADEYDSTLALYFERQNPTNEQLRQGLSNKDEIVRCAMSRNPLIQGESLPKLAKDKNKTVRECLFYRGDADDIQEGEEYVTHWGGEHLPDDIIMILASDSDRYIKDRARKILSIRGVGLTSVRSNVTSNITSLLKKHQAPFGAAKANKKLLELGVLELAERESTSKPGVMREFKQLSDDGQQYGVNKFSQYGDATPEYYIDLFPELLKKIA